MKKAFTLIELLVVLSILPVIALALSQVTWTFVRELPQGVAALSEQTTVLHAIDAIADDVSQAVALPDSIGERQSGEQTLLIALPAGTIAYEWADGWVSRTRLGRDGREDPNTQRQWRVPNTAITWQRWTSTDEPQQAEGAYAVEIHSYVEQVVDGHPRKKFAQTRVHFLSSLGKVREVE
jgi:prepilin-type N-terminal cleavage/methylation domain-containing protein